MTTDERVLYLLRQSKRQALTANELHTALRYRLDARETINRLLARGVIVREQTRLTDLNRGRKPMVYRIATS